MTEYDRSVVAERYDLEKLDRIHFVYCFGRCEAIQLGMLVFGVHASRSSTTVTAWIIQKESLDDIAIYSCTNNNAFTAFASTKSERRPRYTNV